MLGPGFVRYTHSQFLVYSDTSRDTHESLRVVDRCVTEFRRFLERIEFTPTPPDNTTPTIVLFADVRAYSSFASKSERLVNSWMGGYYSVHNNRLVVFDDRSSEAYTRASTKLDEYESEGRRRLDAAKRASGDNAAAARRAAQDALDRVAAERARLEDEAGRALAEKIVHEMTHLLSYNSGLQSPFAQSPFWASEGLATNFETRQPERAFGPDHIDAERFREYVALADARRLMPIASLVQLQAVPPGDSDEAHNLYTQAYVLFNFLYRHRREDLGEFFAAMRDGADDARSAVGGKGETKPSFAEVFVECFGEPSDLQRRVLDDARRQAIR